MTFQKNAGALEITDANDYYPFGMNHLNSGYWIDNLGQMRSTAYAGRARGSLIGLRSDYLRNTEMLGKYSKRAGYVGYAISAGQIGYGTYQDSGKFGVKTQIATANVVGGMAGAWLGGKAGTLAGGELGALIGVWFEGVVAAIGGIVGGNIRRSILR